MFLSLLNQKLSDARNILLIGIGGGFDFVQGVPVYEKLHESGKNVIWANLSFSRVDLMAGYDGVIKVSSGTENTPGLKYFPEKYLMEWYCQQHGRDLSIYSFPRFGPRVIRDILSSIIERHEIDLIFAIDGGTDSLMKGDEPDLGTPEEDLSTLCALRFFADIEQILVTTAFGVDHYNGVQHYYFLKAVSELSANSGFYGVESLLPGSWEADRYCEVLNYIHEKMPLYKSIVSTCIAESLAGRFGDIKLPVQPRKATSFITPLSSMYWYFDAKQVADRCLYIDEIKDLELYPEVTNAIFEKRRSLKIQPDRSIKG